MKKQKCLDNLTKTIQKKLNDSLSSITNSKIKLTISENGILTIPEVHSLMSNSTQQVTTVYIPLMGDIVGDIFLFLSESSDTHIADMMLGNEIGTTNILGEFETSAIKELGNITTGVIVTELADQLGISMMLTTPNIATDMASALVDQVLVQYGEVSNDLLAMEFVFNLKEEEVNGSFLLLFDNESSQKMRESLKEKDCNN